MAGVYRLVGPAIVLVGFAVTGTFAEPTDGSHRAAPRVIALPPRDYFFTIDSKTPLKDLMPIPPKVADSFGPMLDDDLAKVAEVMLYDPSAINTKPKDEKINVLNPLEFVEEQIAFQIAKINYLNKENKDRFIELLIANRPDLAGLPFAMGAACRQDEGQAKRFQGAVGHVQNNPSSLRRCPSEEESYWKFMETHEAGDMPRAITQARIAALMQIFAPEATKSQVSLTQFLAKREHKEAGRALAQLATFSPEADVRKAALAALEKRPQEANPLLLAGLRYPWPAVAANAAAAMVALKRAELVPQLVNALAESDPRAPFITEVDGKTVTLVREVVRINHHRNCLLCHAPGNTPDLIDPVPPKEAKSRERKRVRTDLVTAPVPLPGHPFGAGSGRGYGRNSSPDILVRVDVTYLRQDFSMLMPVADAKPWPDKQRFDFMVRTRVIDEKEAKRYHDVLGKAPSPYRAAIHTALKALTGRDPEPNAAAWRKVLEKS
jgi:hypothetical protein